MKHTLHSIQMNTESMLKTLLNELIVLEYIDLISHKAAYTFKGNTDGIKVRGSNCEWCKIRCSSQSNC